MVNKRIINYMKTEEAQGYAPKQLRDFLIQQGYNVPEVDEAMSYADSRNIYPKAKKATKTKKPQKRPASVTALSVLFFVLGGFSIILSMFFMIMGYNFIGVLSIIPVIGPILSNLVMMLAVMGLVMGAINVLIGWGLLKLKNWARISAIVLLIIGLVLSILLAILTISATILLIIFLISAALQVLILYILRKDDVKKAFEVGKK
ncbi:hypothetical protein KY358_02295 [Candidatus Woesearchaeota archaeon]|nr:hypothetical protein [Candidatus Woesearchaeota archaeon]